MNQGTKFKFAEEISGWGFVFCISFTLLRYFVNFYSSKVLESLLLILGGGYFAHFEN